MTMIAPDAGWDVLRCLRPLSALLFWPLTPPAILLPPLPLRHRGLRVHMPTSVP